MGPSARISSKSTRCRGCANFAGSTKRHNSTRVTGFTSMEQRSRSRSRSAAMRSLAFETVIVRWSRSVGHAGHRCRQLLADQVFDLLPDMRVAFNFFVASREDAGEPGRLLARNRMVAVIHSEIAENLRVGSIRRHDGFLSVNKPLFLIEIRRITDILRNYGIVLATFRRAVHLNGEEHRNSLAVQFLCERHHSPGSRTMAVKDNPGRLLLFVGQR